MEIISANKPAVVRKLEKPIFVVGCCNSGTTILWRSLLSHPDFSGPTTEGQDLKTLPGCMKHFLGKQTFRMFAHPRFGWAYRLTEKDYQKVVAKRLAAVYAEHCEQGKRFIEKSPANSMRTRFLQTIFSDASFIIVVRNGMAVSEGIRRKRWRDPDRQHMAGLRTTIAEAAEQWLHTNRILMEDRSYLKRSIVIKYEDLVADTPMVLRSVLDFCECHSTNFPIPEFETDHNAKQIARLTAKEKETVSNIAGDLLTVLGYCHRKMTSKQFSEEKSLV